MKHGEPAYGIAQYFPMQGYWDETDYLGLDQTIENQRFIELVCGRLEFISMPTRWHERIVKYLYRALSEYNLRRCMGEVFFSGSKLRLHDGEIRIPDISLVTNPDNDPEEYCTTAILVMEVISKGAEDRKRDVVKKRLAYASAGIPEYWIVDPQLKHIQVLTLNGGKKYKAHGVFKRGEKARSKLLQGFEVDVTEALAGLKQ